MKKEKLKDQLGSGFSWFRFLQVGGYIQGSGFSRKGDIYKVQSSPGKGDTYKVQGSPGKEIYKVQYTPGRYIYTRFRVLRVWRDIQGSGFSM